MKLRFLAVVVMLQPLGHITLAQEIKGYQAENTQGFSIFKTKDYLDGVGLTLYTESPQSIKYVNPDSPAAKAGLRAGDLITTIDGTPTSSLDLKKMTSLLRGKPGSQVILKVIRNENELVKSITRERLQIENSFYMPKTIGNYLVCPDGNVIKRYYTWGSNEPAPYQENDWFSSIAQPLPKKKYKPSSAVYITKSLKPLAIDEIDAILTGLLRSTEETYESYSQIGGRYNGDDLKATGQSYTMSYDLRIDYRNKLGKTISIYNDNKGSALKDTNGYTFGLNKIQVKSILLCIPNGGIQQLIVESWLIQGVKNQYGETQSEQAYIFRKVLLGYPTMPPPRAITPSF